MKMEKQDMVKKLQQITGSLFINRTELAKAMGRSDPHQVDWILVGLERIKIGKLYYIPDVVERILSGTETR